MKLEPIAYTKTSHIPIWFEDQHCCVLSKPRGIASQAGGNGANLVALLQDHFGRPYVGLVHRLDQPTSGLMVVAKRSKAAHKLTVALQTGKILRRYQAWLLGDFEQMGSSAVLWVHYLKKNEAQNKSQVFEESLVGAKKAETWIKVLKTASFRGEKVTLCEFELQTGRSHQIRAVAAHLGFPLLGDQKYGSANNQGSSFPFLALHSSFLSFLHPMSGVPLCFQEELVVREIL